MAIAEVRNASKHYGSGETLVKAVDEISVSFEPGEFTVICGPSGSGKTTLLNLIGCLDVPSSGEVLIEGTDVSKLTGGKLSKLRAQRIGFIFQDFNLVPVLTATENVEAALHLARTPGDRRAAARQILDDVGLEDMHNRRPTQLSGGQQQRVAVARALVKKPALVIADEPTANLDTDTGAQILELMRVMNRDLGVTFLFSTHDPRVMERADRIITLVDGKVAEDEIKEAA